MLLLSIFTEQMNVNKPMAWNAAYFYYCVIYPPKWMWHRKEAAHNIGGNGTWVENEREGEWSEED